MTSPKFGWSHRVSSVNLFSCVIFLLVLLLPVLATAQEPAHALQDLQSSLGVGDTIRVEVTDGRSVEGKLESISNSSVKLKANGVSREFREPQIREVKVKYSDPIGNGLKIGAIVGAVSGAVVGIVVSGAFCDGCGRTQASAVLGMGLFGAGIGAGSGAAGDFLRKSYTSVFKAPKIAEKQFGISPILARKTKGVALAFRF